MKKYTDFWHRIFDGCLTMRRTEADYGREWECYPHEQSPRRQSAPSTRTKHVKRREIQHTYHFGPVSLATYHDHFWKERRRIWAFLCHASRFDDHFAFFASKVSRGSAGGAYKSVSTSPYPSTLLVFPLYHLLPSLTSSPRPVASLTTRYTRRRHVFDQASATPLYTMC